MAHRLIRTRRGDLHPGRQCPAKPPLPRLRAVLTTAVATVLIVGGVAPANADRLEWTDLAGDMTAFTESSEETTSAPAPDHRAGDVTSAVLRHGRRAVAVKVSYAQLRRAHFNGLGGSLRTRDVTRQYFVEDEIDARPRLYVFNKRYKRVCRGATFDVDYKANTLAIRVPRKCLKRPNWVKATAMAANDPVNGSNTYYLDDAFSATPVDAELRATWTARVKRR